MKKFLVLFSIFNIPFVPQLMELQAGTLTKHAYKSVHELTILLRKQLSILLRKQLKDWNIADIEEIYIFFILLVLLSVFWLWFIEDIGKIEKCEEEKTLENWQKKRQISDEMIVVAIILLSLSVIISFCTNSVIPAIVLLALIFLFSLCHNKLKRFFAKINSPYWIIVLLVIAMIFLSIFIAILAKSGILGMILFSLTVLLCTCYDDYKKNKQGKK